MTDSHDYRKYLEQRFDDLTTLMNARFNVVDGDNKEINDHLKKLNGSVEEHAKQLVDLRIKEELHIAECPAMPLIAEVKTNINKIQADVNIGGWFKKHWKLSLLIFIITLFVSYSLFELFGIREIASYFIK